MDIKEVLLYPWGHTIQILQLWNYYKIVEKLIDDLLRSKEGSARMFPLIIPPLKNMRVFWSIRLGRVCSANIVEYRNFVQRKGASCARCSKAISWLNKSFFQRCLFFGSFLSFLSAWGDLQKKQKTPAPLFSDH